MTTKCQGLRIVIVAVFLLFSPSAVSAQALTLEESIAIALKNSYVLDIAKEGVKGAQAQRRRP